jgi:hypothetical protein
MLCSSVRQGLAGTCLVAGLWSLYTKLPTLTPQFLKLRLLHKISIWFNNGKPLRHLITTTWIIRLLFWLITLFLIISLRVTVAVRALNLEYLVKILNWGQCWSRYIFTDSNSDSKALLSRMHSVGQRELRSQVGKWYSVKKKSSKHLKSVTWTETFIFRGHRKLKRGRQVFW